jgi:hypothetical protein
MVIENQLVETMGVELFSPGTDHQTVTFQTLFQVTKKVTGKSHQKIATLMGSEVILIVAKFQEDQK